MKNVIWIALGMMCGLSACSELTEISEVPEISFESVVPNVVTEYQDSLYFTLSYRDGNGDLGQNNTDENNLFIQDSRNEVTFGFRIQQLAPDNSDIAIQGNFNVALPNTAIINGGASESVSYVIWVVDRAGNESNRVNSSTVTVNAQ